jgi:hypothetical protein
MKLSTASMGKPPRIQNITQTPRQSLLASLHRWFAR